MPKNGASKRSALKRGRADKPATRRNARPQRLNADLALRERLREAEETINAICNGEVDAVVVRSANGPQVYSLAGAERPYRVYVERMQEGAVTVSREGIVLYSNHRFAEMVQTPLERVISSPLHAHLGTKTWQAISRGLAGGDGVVKQEGLLHRQSDAPLPVHVTASHLPLGDEDVLCLVITDLTEQKEKAELRLGKELAEKASLAKDSFIAAVSHELRTPLTPALMAASALEKDPDVPERIRSEITLIRRNIELEARLIDDLLDVTRIARGKMELHVAPMDVHDILNCALQICHAEFDARQHRIQLDLQAVRTRTVGDPVRLQQAIWNLLRNAAKFTPEGGVVTVRSSNPRNDGIRIEVADTGIGFEPGAQARLFQSFEQGGRHVTRQFGGLGLGLTITRSIVEAHGGTISAASDGPGEGARFSFELPLHSTVADGPPPARPEPIRSAPEARLRILLVEDHRDSRQALERLLSVQQHTVRSAASASEALEVAAAQAFDLVISDLGLPDMSGIELMRRLASSFGIRGVALSGYGMEQDIAESRRAGFQFHLTKPVQLDQLRAVIARIGHDILTTKAGNHEE